METQKTEPRQMSLDETEKLFFKEQEAAEQERAANRRYLKLADGAEADFWLSGKTLAEEVTFEGKPKLMLQYELQETTPRGEHKIFSLSARAKANKDLLNAIRAKKLHVHIKRSGLGNETEYIVMAAAV